MAFGTATPNPHTGTGGFIGYVIGFPFVASFGNSAPAFGVTEEDHFSGRHDDGPNDGWEQFPRDGYSCLVAAGSVSIG